MPRLRSVASRRPGAPLLAGLVGGVLVAALALPAMGVAAGFAPATAAGAPDPAAQGSASQGSPSPSPASRIPGSPGTVSGAAAPAPGSSWPVSGLALGADRLPDCSAVVVGLASRDKLAQRLMVGVSGDDPGAVAEAVHATQVGGIFVGGNATRLLTGQALRGVQAQARIPLAVAVDDEGGRVQRIDTLDGNLPSPRALARTRTPAQVRELARDRARALLAHGITMNLAPVVDVSDEPSDAVIGDRSFSNDPDTVTAYASAYAQGQREAGVFTVLKHFPGHGHASGDSHRGPVTTPPLDALRADDLRPYAALLGPAGPLDGDAGRGRTGVMVGHLDVPGLTDGQPASVSPAAYRLLRVDYHFDGLVLTDDLGAMKAITDELTLPRAVEKALESGADMALWTSGEPAGPILDTLAQDLAAGRLDPQANDLAVGRVLAAKGVCTRR